MAKKVLTLIKLQIPAGAANPAPPVGPALGQHGVNIMEFCKAFNAQTQSEGGTIIPVEITVYRGPLLHLHHQDAAGGGADQGGDRAREGLRRAPHQQGRHDQHGPGAPDRRAQDARPQRQRPRRRVEDHRRHRPLDGRRRGGCCMAHGKRYREQYAKIDRDRAYPPAEAVALLKETASAAFDETVELHVRLGVNVRHAEEQLRGTLALPHGLGKDVTIAVFAQGDKARDAEAAGADFVGGRRPRQADRGRLDRLRRRDRDPGHDAHGRQARPHPRAPGQDAEPEGRHGHRRHREGSLGVQVGQGRVPHRPPGRGPPGNRQGQLRGLRICSTTTTP